MPKEEQDKKEEQQKEKEQKRLRGLAYQYFEIIVDRKGEELSHETRKLFGICAPDISYLIKETEKIAAQTNNGILRELNPQEKKELGAELNRLVQWFLRYYKVGFHPLKNIVLVNYIRTKRVRRLTSQNTYYIVGFNEKQTQPFQPQDQQTQKIYGNFKKAFAALRQNQTYLKQLFDAHIRPRYKTSGMGDIEIDDIRDTIIQKLATQTSFDVVEGAMELFPGVPDIFTHTRRNISRRRQYDPVGDPYAIWIGQFFLIKVLTTQNWAEILGRILLESVVRFDHHDETMPPHDQTFWKQMQQLTEIGQRLELKENKDYKRLVGIFQKAADINDTYDIYMGMSIVRLAFFNRCFSYMQRELQQNPLLSDDELIDILWPMWLERSNEISKEDVFERHTLKDLRRNYLVWTKQARRFTPEGSMLIPTRGDGPSEEIKPGGLDYELYKPILDMTTKIRDPEFISNVFDKYMRRKYTCIGVPEEEIQQAKQKLVDDLMCAHIDIDTLDEDVFLHPYTSATGHARGGYSQKHDYDGKKYGIWMTEIFVRVCMLAEKGDEILAWHCLEEIEHAMRPNKWHRPHGDWKIYGDHQQYVYHPQYYWSLIVLLPNILDDAKKFAPGMNLLFELRKANKRDRHFYVQLIEKAAQILLDGDTEQDGLFMTWMTQAMHKADRENDIMCKTKEPFLSMIHNQENDSLDHNKINAYLSHVLSWFATAAQHIQDDLFLDEHSVEQAVLGAAKPSSNSDRC